MLLFDSKKNDNLRRTRRDAGEEGTPQGLFFTINTKYVLPGPPKS